MVIPLLDRALLPGVNACEAPTRLVDRGLPREAAAPRAGLSPGDRACLARRTGLPACTADRPWAETSLPLDLRLIR